MQIEPDRVVAETHRPTLWQWAALALGVLALGSGLLAWWLAGNDETVGLAAERDSALISARSAIEVMNTLDHRDIDGGLEAWAAVSTGTLHDQLVQVGEEERQLLADQGKVSTGKVVDAAVLSLDGGSATVIASIEVTVTDPTDPASEPTIKRNRLSADLVREAGDWKLEEIGQVAVDLP